MLRRLALLALLTVVSPAAAQDLVSTTENPLDALNQQLQRVLADAEVPFSTEQERAIALMMEERRRASEELFGDLMDFRAGPTQRQQEDRLRSAIEWLRNEFISNLTAYLTPDQAAVWNEFLRTGITSDERPRRPPPAQTQYVRINTNVFTAETISFSSGSQNTEIIQRGGAGAWHGNTQFLLKDDALNARNAFAGNKPSYQERRLGFDVSGPVIRGRLTSSVAGTQNEAKNADTVHATLPSGVFSAGITRPNVFRQINSRSTLQLADAHSLRFYGRYAGETGRNQGVGGFSLPERASTSRWRGWELEAGHFSSLSGLSILEGNLRATGRNAETIPSSDATRVNVLDAFNSGGSQNRGEDTSRTYNFSNLYTRLGNTATLKTGMEANYRRQRSESTSNFGGTFTFSSLDAFLAGRPVNYRVSSGNPLLDVSQLELSFFAQTDVSLTRQVTLLFGVRYDTQTNLDDWNNIAPRFGFAYAPGPRTVLRGGGGVFYSRLGIGMIENQRRHDGTRQFEIVIDNPSYPDPFGGGTIRQSLPSVRVTDANLVAPYFAVGMISVERTLFANLLVSASYDYQREFHRLRTRDLNAPFDVTAPVPRACYRELPPEACVRPDPTRGNVVSLESRGSEIRHNVRVNARQRFSIFNVSAGYQLQRAFGDVQGSPGTAATDSYNPRGDWGRAPFPLHQANGTVNAQLPLGVFLTGRVSGRSGRHYTITTGFDDNRDTNVTDRPPGIPPNSVRGPKYLNFDFNISKAFFFRRGGGSRNGMNMNVFANMTNAFNHVHYGTPSGVMTSPNFGRSTSASDPREIEVGVRFQF